MERDAENSCQPRISTESGGRDSKNLIWADVEEKDLHAHLLRFTSDQIVHEKPTEDR